MEKDEFNKVLLCISCGNKTLMNKVASYENKVEDWTNCEYSNQQELLGISYDIWNLYFCPVCHNVTLELAQWETYSSYPKIVYEIIYPTTISKSHAVPLPIKNAFEAALKVRHLDGAICALSIRRTLEMMCKEEGEIKGNLYEKLTALGKRGVLPPILDKMASVLRTLGNDAAHAGDKDFPPELVSSMIEFTEIILDYVYVLPSKLAEIQSDIDKEKTKPETDVTKVEITDLST
ncbi:DUF4145 domain-containing protein [Pelosinus sp. sgz500959]|uniref:DUF4145 domain-containing protein n=1 Tax=Pelosinus sp. sgz500959 TaxID=3242472 RepID=UPI00366F2D24